ncbi:MAG: DUF3473 domain-containing protein [Deferrisomatales bacterium]|nr:DUF3473 domain-containing protein [Deferrisomatales bacterium]
MNPQPTTQNPKPLVNILTIDVEDYFQVSAFEAVSPPSSWPERELRVEGNTDRILGLLADRGVHATFFVLGWVAERCPGLVARIARAGHEVASHGNGHRRVYNQTRDEFREDLRRSKALLEDQSGQPVLGYRAPSYSISQGCLWAFDELVEAGFVYDSSVFPIRHDLYGMPDWPRFPFAVERLEDGNWVPAERGCSESQVVSTEFDRNPKPKTQNPKPKTDLLELPITTLQLFGHNLPIAGGGYFRLFPYAFTRWGLRRINRLDGQPFVFYLHPWELDPEQPRMRGAGFKSRFRHYLNLRKTELRFGRLLDDFQFSPIRNVVSELPGLSASQLPSSAAGGSA